MKNMCVKLSLISLTVTMLFGCDPVQELKINNLSNHDLFVSTSFSEVFKIEPVLLNAQGDTLWENMIFIPANGETILPVIGRKGWEGIIKVNSKEGKLTTFFFTRELLGSISSPSLLKYQMFSKKITLTADELINLNWEIDFKL